MVEQYPVPPVAGHPFIIAEYPEVGKQPRARGLSKWEHKWFQSLPGLAARSVLTSGSLILVRGGVWCGDLCPWGIAAEVLSPSPRK
jgi:hypothetical protein